MALQENPALAVAIVAVEARRPSAADKSVLVDALQTVGIRARDRSAHRLIQYLCVSRRIQIVNEVFRGGAAHGLRDARREDACLRRRRQHGNARFLANSAGTVTDTYTFDAG